MDSNTTRTPWPEQRTRAFTRERILSVLGTTQRPLRWAELTEALGVLTDEGRMECEWLMDHGYIAPVRNRDEASRATETLWTFGERGLAWAKHHGAPLRSAP
ncbi:MAG: hypothetical protein WDO68_23010 [Gammaproteobacteria bacterium]